MFGDDAQSPGELLELIRWLPDTSAFRAVQAAEAAERDAKGEAGPPARMSRFDPMRWFGWGTDRYALTALVNEARNGNYLTAMVNRDPKQSKPKKPDLFLFPGERKQSVDIRAMHARGVAQQKKATR